MKLNFETNFPLDVNIKLLQFVNIFENTKFRNPWTFSNWFLNTLISNFEIIVGSNIFGHGCIGNTWEQSQKLLEPIIVKVHFDLGRHSGTLPLGGT